MGKATMTRRSFVKATAATVAAAGAACAIESNFVRVDPALADEVGQEEVIRTSCRACIQNCAIKAHVRNGRVIRLEGDDIDPMSHGRICAKGMAGIQALYNPNRMKYPMKRVGDRGSNQWERISWEEAVTTIAEALIELDEKGDSLQLITSTGGGGNPQFFSAIRFAGVFQGNFFEPGCAQCYLPRNMAQPAVNGTCDNSIADSDAQEIYFDDNETECLVLWGTVPAYHGPATGGNAVARLRAKGVPTVVIDPRFTADAAKADVWLSIRPGTDVALMMAWIKYIIDNEAFDRDFVTKWTNAPFLINESTMMQYKASELGIGTEDEYVVWDRSGQRPVAMPYPWDDSIDVELDGEFMVEGKASRTGWRAIRDSVEDFTLAKAAEICWLRESDIKAAVDLFIQGSPHAGICLGVATDQYEQSAQAAQGSAILDVIMGNIQRPGNLTQARPGTFPLTYIVHNFGMFGPHPLAMDYEKRMNRLGYMDHKGLGFWFASHIPTVRQALETGEPYKPKIWIDRSGNKPVMLGGSNQFMAAAKEFELVVHMFMYPTAMSVEAADILLPTAEWLETAYAASRMNVMLIRQDVTHLYEAVDETMAWSWIAFKMAELGHERFKMACDPDVATQPGQPISAYWRTYDEYKDYVAAFAGSCYDDQKLGLTWDEFAEMAPNEWTDLAKWKNHYEDYLEINPETGQPKGFANTWSRKCEIYLDQFVRLGRTGQVAGRGDLQEMFPPASVDYSPVLRYVEPDESPLDDEEYPFALTQGRLPMYHHGTLRNVPYLREIYPVPQAWINPVDAEEHGLKTGDWIKLTSRRGETHGQVLVTEGIPPKVIYQERFWNPELLDSDDPKRAWQAMNVNVLTRNDGPFNPEFGTYTLRGFQVKIEKSTMPVGVWTEPEDFRPWMPEPSEDTGGGYAVYDA